VRAASFLEISMRLLLQALLCLALAATNCWAGAFVDLHAAGAKCDGVSDDSAAIASAVAKAQAQRVPLHVPAGACRYSSTIVLTALVPLVGEGSAISRLMYCGAGDAVLIRPPLGDGDLNRRHLIRGLTIAPCTPLGGVSTASTCSFRRAASTPSGCGMTW
jgi:hypothetical protein